MLTCACPPCAHVLVGSRNANNKLDVVELRTALNALGLDTTSTQASKVLERYDDRGLGTLNLEEFHKLVGELRRFLTTARGDDLRTPLLERPSGVPLPPPLPPPSPLHRGMEGRPRTYAGSQPYDSMSVL